MLKDSAELVDFLLRQFNEDGGFADRTGESDLYTVFGIDGLIALQAELPMVGSTCGASGTERIWISFISVASRARAAASLQNEKPNGAIVQRICGFALAMAALIFSRIRARDGLRMFPGVWGLSGPRLRVAECFTRRQCLISKPRRAPGRMTALQCAVRRMRRRRQ